MVWGGGGGHGCRSKDGGGRIYTHHLTKQSAKAARINDLSVVVCAAAHPRHRRPLPPNQDVSYVPPARVASSPGHAPLACPVRAELTPRPGKVH